MSGKDIAEEIARGASHLEVPLDRAAVNRLVAYVAELDRWRHTFNLVGPGSIMELVERHVIDSLGLLRLMDQPEVRARVTSWVDVGSGAGAPGLICALARPQMSWVLLEPMEKRVAFLEAVLRKGGAPSCGVMRGRLEDLEPRPAVGLVSRATFGPEEWVQHARDRVGPRGLVAVTMAGEGVREICEGAWRVDRFSLPTTGARRVNALLDNPG